MDNKKIVKNYLKKYFEQQYFEENDSEFNSLLRILNKKDNEIEKLKSKKVTNCKNCDSTEIAVEVVYRCEKCSCWHDQNGSQI